MNNVAESSQKARVVISCHMIKVHLPCRPQNSREAVIIASHFLVLLRSRKFSISKRVKMAESQAGEKEREYKG